MGLKKLVFYTVSFFVCSFVAAQNGVSPEDIDKDDDSKAVSVHGYGDNGTHSDYVFSKWYKQKSELVLPEAYDLRTIEGGKFISPVKNQGSEGTCWAFAAYGAVESFWLKQGKGQFDFSERHMATCHGFDLSVEDGGSAEMAAAYLARLSGAVAEANVPYTYPLETECVGWVKSAGYVTEARFLPGNKTASSDLALLSQVLDGKQAYNRALVKQTIIEDGGLYINMYADYERFFNPSDNSYFYCGTNVINHAVLLVGWDDNKLVTGNGIIKPKTKGAWICRNSWGKGWGEQGFFYISYEDSRALRTIAYFPSAIDYDEHLSVFQYDDRGFESTYGFDNNEACGLVKFTTQYSTQLSSVGLNIVAENEAVSIEVYDEFNGKQLSGLIGVAEGVASFPGFYTFGLSDGIIIPPHTDFFVKVSYQSTDTNKPLAIENSQTAFVETNKCWIKNVENDPWVGIGEGTQYRFDLCIKAYGNIETNASFFDEDNEKVLVDWETLNIETSSPNGIIYPNPCNGELFIEGQDLTGANVQLINNGGLVVLSKKISTDRTLLDLGRLAPGLYFVKVEKNSMGVFTQKLIKH